MRLKPKKTVFNERALLYRRYIGLEQSSLLDKIYRYRVNTFSNRPNPYQYFQFNRNEKRFIEIDPSIAIKSDTIDADPRTVFKYQDKLYQYWYRINKDIRYWNIYTKDTLIINIDMNSINYTSTIGFYTSKPLDSAPTIRIRAKGEGRFLLRQLKICADNEYSIYSSWYGLKNADVDKVIVANDDFVELELDTISGSQLASDEIQLYRGSVNNVQVDFNGTIEVELPNGLSFINDLQLEFGDIGKYQTNNYYFVGSFDYMVTGNIEQSNTQYLKGNIMPLTSLNIKHYNDSIDIRQDDLVVVNHHLYSVESPSKSHLHFPKDYYVYYATLNSIL